MDLRENSTTTTGKPPVHKEHRYLIVPLVVVVIIIIFAIIVYFMAKRKLRLRRLRQNLVVMYEFDSNEHEWESLNSYDNPDYSGIRITNTTV